jgi:ComF family protein
MVSLKSITKNYMDGLLTLIFPDHCQHCHILLNKNETVLCRACTASLPSSGFEKEPNNRVFQTFWGRVPIHFAASAFHFRKGELLQQLIHQLKYRNKPDTGIFLGRLMGQKIMASSLFENPDTIIPVPLHPLKQQARGYNQSLMIAKGVAEITGATINTSVLFRKTHHSSQTNKKHYERWLNVEDNFFVVNSSTLENHHILLVDDIITTGATLEACAQKLLQIKNVKISIMTAGDAS